MGSAPRSRDPADFHSVRPSIARRERWLFPFRDIFRDIHDVVLEYEKIRSAFPGQAHHIPVVVLDPAAHNFPIRQFDADGFLFLAQLFQVSGFFEGFIRWRSLSTSPGRSLGAGVERHATYYCMFDKRAAPANS